ncbi:MAG: hypothetical protein R3233_05015 [Xanthomonadales bacterium]|nr:hypothetical protein [Xanthomonadales bacterium]
MKIRSMALLLVFVLAACDSRQAPVYQGGLYFGVDSYVMRYSLRDGSLTAEGHLGDTVSREVSPFCGDHLLIAESASVNRRSVPRISWFDLRTGESVDLYPGLLARYLPEAGLVAYDDGLNLYAVPQLDGSAFEVIYGHAQNQLSQLLAAPPGLLLFEATEGGAPLIRSWSTQTGEVRALDALTRLCRLQGAVWIEPLERLACKRRSGSVAEAGYVLAALDGTVEGSLDLPEDGLFLALAYLPEPHALALRETRRGLFGTRDTHSVWVYELDSGTVHQLPGSANLGTSAVYAAY